jgi:hypothetical protein
MKSLQCETFEHDYTILGFSLLCCCESIHEFLIAVSGQSLSFNVVVLFQPFVDALVSKLGCRLMPKFVYGTTHVLVKTGMYCYL